MPSRDAFFIRFRGSVCTMAAVSGMHNWGFAGSGIRYANARVGSITQLYTSDQRHGTPCQSGFSLTPSNDNRRLRSSRTISAFADTTIERSSSSGVGSRNLSSHAVRFGIACAVIRSASR